MELQDYVDIALEDIQRDKDNGRDKRYFAIDDMLACKFDMPEELKKLPWIRERKFVTTVPRDSSVAAARTFATLMPLFDIAPLTNAEGEYERVEKMEQAVEWHFKQLCYRTTPSVLWKIVKSAVDYCNVSMETEYLPYALKGQDTDRTKQLINRGAFNFPVHHPANVHARFSKYGLECVTLAYVCTAQDIIDKYGEKNSGVKKLLAKVTEYADQGNGTAKAKKNVDYRQTDVCFYKYTDWDERVIWVCIGDDVTTCGSPIEIPLEVDGKVTREHGLDFIPWVVIDNKEPILRGVVDADLFKTDCILRTIEFSKSLDLAGHPSYWTRVLSDEDNVDINHDDPSNPIKMTQGQEAGVFPPPQIDPGLSKAVSTADSDIYRSAGTSAISNLEQYVGANTTFSTLNAVLKASVAQLGLARITAEQALSEGIHQIFRWIDYSGEPLMAYRSTTKDEKNKAGDQFMIYGGQGNTEGNKIYFDPDELYITVNLQEQTIADEQGQVTNAINKTDRLGFSLQTVHDQLGANFDREQSQRAYEKLFESEIGKKLAMDQAEVQLYIYARQKEIDAQVQQAQQSQQMQQQQDVQRQAGANAAVQGIDQRGAAPQAGAGGMMGREQVTGQDMSGQGLA